MKINKDLLNELSMKIISAIGQKRYQYFVHEPILASSSNKYLMKCIDSNNVSSMGEYIQKFEEKLKKITNSKYIVLTNTGTAALFIALKRINVKDCEVLVPSMTFAATSNAVIYNDGIPHYIDSCHDNPCLDIDKLSVYLEQICIMKNNICYNKKSKRRIKSLVVVHAYGYMTDMSKLIKLCKKYNLKLLEDAAGALGSYYKNKHAGTFSDYGIISFNGNKIVTTGMGGALLLKNHTEYKEIKHIISTSRLQHPYEIEHDSVGYNLRMTNINAALGYSQLINFQSTLKKKKKLYQRYLINLKESEICRVIEEKKFSNQNHWINNLIIKDKYINNKKEIFEYLHLKGIRCRASWKPQHLLKMNLSHPRMKMENCIKLWKSTISLPSSYI
tara:strand:+ start:12207 stop:13370 length:1164 start_codon:yes stop_codon:yes gene_type:complete